MKTNKITKAIAIMITTILLILPFTSVSAFDSLQATDNNAEFEPGAVIVSLKSNSPSASSLLNGFEIEEERLITPGSNTQNVYLVIFKEKTKEIVWRAIDVLKKSPCVVSAEPDYYQYVDDEVEETVSDSNLTEPITTESPTDKLTEPVTNEPTTEAFDVNNLPEILADGNRMYPEVCDGKEVYYCRYSSNANGTIKIWSGGAMETFRRIYDENLNLLISNNDLEENVLKNEEGCGGLSFEVEAGKTYVIAVGMYETCDVPEKICFWVDFSTSYLPTETTETLTDKPTEPVTTEPTEPPTDKPTEPVTTEPTTETAEPTTEITAPTTVETQPATEAAPKNTYEDFSYKVNGKAVTITKYNGNSTSVSIPATIDGKPVTVIGKEAFKGNKTLQKVTISKNVATIERDAFEKCTKLNKVTFSKSVKQINRYAFAECKKLTSVTLPANLTKLNEGVFNNTGLKSIKITKKIKAINPIALEIDSLKKITVAKNNTKFSDKAGVLYNKKQTKLLICPRKIAKKSLIVPSTVKTIDDFAFSQNKILTKVTLPKKLKKIGMSAFANVKKLKTITIPKSVNNIEDAAFIKPMKLKGYKKSVAETYAKAYGLKFIKLG